ncbi:Protein of unknown function [Bacillus cereus]|nr:Protein of unknown function [Bacillus cereus]
MTHVSVVIVSGELVGILIYQCLVM